MHLQFWVSEQLLSPKGCSSGVLLTLKFFRSTVVFGNSYFYNDLFEESCFCKENRFFSKHHFQLSIFLKQCVISFIERSSARSLIFFLRGAAWPIHLSSRVIFFYRSGPSHPFFQGLYRTDNFSQQLLIKTLINTTTY